MYKLLTFFSVIFISYSASSQSESVYFSVTSYYTGTEFYKTDTVSVKDTKKTLDIYFYKEHFHQFYGLPKKLIRKEYKNQEIIEWSKKDAPKDDMGNWSDAYTYDSNGRLNEYSYSSCGFCSQLPWGYTLAYDERNNVIEQQTYFFSGSITFEKGKPITNSKPNEQTRKSIQLTYDSSGNIILLKEYNQQGIHKKIQFLN